MNEIINQINSIIRNITNNDTLTIEKTSTVQDINNWSSLLHIQFIAAVEKQFQIRFTFLEIQGWKNMEELADIINRKTALNQ